MPVLIEEPFHPGLRSNVTAGTTVSKVTVLSVVVDAVLAFPRASVDVLAAIVAVTDAARSSR